MMKKIFFTLTTCTIVLFSIHNGNAYKQGKHTGEVKQLDVDIRFSRSSGTTVTDVSGTHYHVYGRVHSENKVYTPEYWGTYPLYFFGRTVGVTVTVTNKGPRKKAKLLIRTQAYVLHTNGTNGASLITPRSIVIEVGRGETQVIDASFVVSAGPNVDSGLDRFEVLVAHMNSGGGPGNPYPALVMVKEGIFCPPEFVQ